MIRNPWTHKNIKLFYYAKGSLMEGFRRLGDKRSRERLMRSMDTLDREQLETRLSYYNKVDVPFKVPEDAEAIGDLKLPKKNKAYYFDLIEFTRYFPDMLKFQYQFGDVTQIPLAPALVKSRPILEDNENSVLFKFNKVRHYTFTNDRIPYSRKKDVLIGRASVKQEHRREFLRMYFGHPMCDLGQINSGTNHDEWLKDKITINEHLKYKFVWCQEGNDVASNLKWVMSSNSIAVMPPPKYETWFMEGRLRPNVHYIPLKEDYSDLEEQLDYYLRNADEAQNIIKNANAYVRKFRDPKLEKVLCLLVMDKYFAKSGQLSPLFPKWY
ncbi:glycosyl transferase family 90 [Flavobacteriaceae bacterium GF1]